MQQTQHLPASVRATGLHAYQPLIAAMLRRLDQERLVERIHRRDASLWYPAAETQARILSRLGWLDLPSADLAPIEAWAQMSQAYPAILYVGPGDASVIARLWRDLLESSRLTVLDTVDPSAVQSTLAAIDWERTAIVLAAESELTPDMAALARLVVATRAAAAPTSAPPLTVIAPPDSALLSLIPDHDPPTLLALPPDLGARFGALSALGLAPAALLGWEIERLAAAAVAMSALCKRSDDLHTNPGVWLGTTLAILAQQGRDKLTLLASPALAPLARWIAAFVSGCLSKHGRGFVVGEEPQINTEGPHPPAPSPTSAGEGEAWIAYASPSPALVGEGVLRSSGGEGRIVVVLRVAGDDNMALDESWAAFAAVGAPVLTFDLADRHEVAAQVVWWQIAAATIGVVLGLNPFDEPDTAARNAYLWRRLQQPDRVVLARGDSIEVESLGRAVQRLRPAIESAGCLVIAAYLPQSEAVSAGLDDLRALLARRFGIVALAIDPLRDLAFATQVLHAGRPCPILLLTAQAQTAVAVPGLPWPLNDLRDERIAADCMAWNRLDRLFAHLDLGADPEAGLRRCIALLARMAQD